MFEEVEVMEDPNNLRRLILAHPGTDPKLDWQKQLGEGGGRQVDTLLRKDGNALSDKLFSRITGARDGDRFVIIGPRMSGKSTAMADLETKLKECGNYFVAKEYLDPAQRDGEDLEWVLLLAMNQAVGNDKYEMSIERDDPQEKRTALWDKFAKQCKRDGKKIVFLLDEVTNDSVLHHTATLQKLDSLVVQTGGVVVSAIGEIAIKEFGRNVGNNLLLPDGGRGGYIEVQNASDKGIRELLRDKVGKPLFVTEHEDWIVEQSGGSARIAVSLSNTSVDGLKFGAAGISTVEDFRLHVDTICAEAIAQPLYGNAQEIGTLVSPESWSSPNKKMVDHIKRVFPVKSPYLKNALIRWSEDYARKNMENGDIDVWMNEVAKPFIDVLSA